MLLPNSCVGRTGTGSGHTQLVGSSEGGLEAIVLDDGAAPLGVTHGAHVSHAQRVTTLTTDVLDNRQQQTSTADNRHSSIRRNSFLLHTHTTTKL